MLIDTHCHIHEPYKLPLQDVLLRAAEADLVSYICVGTSEKSSRDAIVFAEQHSEAYAAIGVHPHDTKDGYAEIARLAGTSNKIVAVGEIGLDYFYSHSPREVQIEALKAQLDVALKHDLPVIFHVREAFDDFWPIFEDRTAQLRAETGNPQARICGVLHSFTDSADNLHKAIEHGLYIGVNGISTFTKDEAQKAMFNAIPLDRLLFETDAPFLTPAPNRGKINEPAYVSLVAAFHAKQRGISLEEIASTTTHNARALFALS